MLGLALPAAVQSQGQVLYNVFLFSGVSQLWHHGRSLSWGVPCTAECSAASLLSATGCQEHPSTGVRTRSGSGPLYAIAGGDTIVPS